VFRAPTGSDTVGRDGQQQGEWVQAGAGIPGSGNFCKGGNAAMGHQCHRPIGMQEEFPIGVSPGQDRRELLL
jgi:hypothetical protein